MLVIMLQTLIFLRAPHQLHFHTVMNAGEHTN